MKKSFPKQGIKRILTSALLIFTIALSAQFAFADVEQNQLLSFKKIFIEPSKDNVDGAFAATIESAYKDIFGRNPRFEVVSKKADSDAVIQTKLEKKSSGTDLEIAMTLTATSEVFSTDKTELAASATEAEIHSGVKALLKTVLRRIPFYGTITGREGVEVTVDIGSAHGLKKGDIVQVSRADQIKRHPLLKSIVDVQMVPVGSIAIDQVEESIAFGHVHSEIAGEKIQRLHKITAVEARIPDLKKERDEPVLGGGLISIDKRTEEPDQANRPQLGFVSIGPVLGSFSASASQNATQNYAGSSFMPGFKVAGELWFTKNWFADLDFTFTTFSFRQTDQSIVPEPEGNGSDSSTRTISFNAGYRYLPTGSIYGPHAFAKLGFRSFVFDTTNSGAVLLSPKTYTGLNLSIGGQLPLTNRNNGLLLGVNILLFPGLTESESRTSGAEPSATCVGFNLGGYYHVTPQVSLRAVLSFDVYTASFGEGDTASSTTQRQLSFIPSILYYF